MCSEQRQGDEQRTQYEQAALFQHPKNFKSKLHAKENVHKPISKRKLELLKEAGQSWKKGREEKPGYSTVFFKSMKHLHSPKRN